MKCKNLWNREFVDGFCTKHFRNREYKRHREDVLFDREKIRMPETQPEVERILHMRRLTLKVDNLRDRLVVLHNQYTSRGISMEERRRFTELRELNEEMTATFSELMDLRRRTHVVEDRQKFVHI
jgi:hypothetical protein